jgi:hypothetical protein
MSGNSAVSICSNALLLLGDRPISSFAENNDRTRLVANLYEYKRERVLRAHPWNCATKRVILSPDTASPEFGWAYQFQLPNDWLRTLSVGENGNEDDYAIEGRKILMNSNACLLRYIWRNEVESTWDSLLVEVMTQVMVAALTYPITKSTTKQATEEEIVKRVLKEARTIDGQEVTPETIGDFPLLANRMR